MTEPDQDALREAARAVPTFYATGARIRTGPYDCSFVFSRSVPVGTGKDEVDTAVCLVSMSPAHAKSILKVLAKHVDQYEKRHGPLPDVDLISDGWRDSKDDAVGDRE